MHHRRLTNIILPAYVLCFVGYASTISVSFGTSGSPIVPPPPPKPTEKPVPPFREPAPVWESQSNDVPNPHPYKPTPAPFPRIYPTTPRTTPEPSSPQPPGQKMYTHIQYNIPKPQPQSVNKPAEYPVQSNAQKFVQAYLPRKPSSPVQKDDAKDISNQNSYQVYEKTEDIKDNTAINYTPSLGVKYIPAFGQVYFTPEQFAKQYPREYSKLNPGENEVNYNEIHSNDVVGNAFQHISDYDLNYEKNLQRRVAKSINYETAVPEIPYNLYHRQYFYPVNYNQH